MVGPVSLRWANEGVGGATGALVVLAVVVTLGLLGFAPLGPGLAAQGVAAALATAGVGGVVFALARREGLPVSGPSSATTLIFAGLLAQLAGDAAWRTDPVATLTPLLAVAGLVVALSGLLQVAFGLLRLGQLAQYVPQPVLAGFMNGVSLLILQAQLPVLLGLGTPQGLQPAVLALGLSTAGVTWGLARWRPRWPAQLLGLVTGLLLSALLHMLAPGLALGPQVGSALASPAAMTPAWSPHLPMPQLPARLLADGSAAFVQRHAAALLGTALMLALIGALESVLSALALERQTGSRARPDATLLALGLSNIVCGLFGGLPNVLLRARALATLQAGGRGLGAALVGSVGFLLVGALLGDLVARLPQAVLAGTMLTVAVALSDRWTGQLLAQWRSGERSADLWQNLAIVALVCAVTVWKGFALGVAAGCLLALVLFVRGMNRSLVRVGYSAAASPSRRVHPPPQEAWLQSARTQIQVLELEGALFFGSAQRLVQTAEALPPGVRLLVLDLNGVSMIDASGAMALERLVPTLADAGVTLLLAGLTPDNALGRQLLAAGCFRGAHRGDWFPDLDRATEAAELHLLASAGLAEPDPRLPLQHSGLFRGLDAAQALVLAAHMPLRRLAAGDSLFQQGDAADGLYVLTRGSLTVLTGLAPGQTPHRLASLPVGWMLGETAMLDGAGRSGTAVADGEVELHHLSAQALQRLSSAHPLIAARLYANIALHLSQRLRRSTRVLHARAA
jgi:MFS superfamily sulfate permease-like transporter